MDLSQIQKAKFHFQPMILCTTIQDWRFLFKYQLPIGELLPLQTELKNFSPRSMEKTKKQDYQLRTRPLKGSQAHKKIIQQHLLFLCFFDRRKTDFPVEAVKTWRATLVTGRKLNVLSSTRENEP